MWEALKTRWRKLDGEGSGPEVARLFHVLLGAVFLIAFGSLASQIDLLIGARGLLPVAPLLEQLGTRADVSWWDFPTVLWLGASDGAIRAWLIGGMIVSGLGMLGFYPRLCWLVLVPLYLSFCIACRDFLSFQWDNMLLECGLLAMFLPRDRRDPVLHFLFRCLLFKLYFESGIAKWQSHLMDWHDGSAMTFYYETVPLPGLLGWDLHHLPEWWHRFESYFAIGFELAISPLVFGPRALRLFALAVFTSFQVVDIATANYGFFCYLSLALHVFLLDEVDVRRLRRLLRRPPRATPIIASWRPRAGLALGLVLATVWLTVSVRLAVLHFTEPAARCAAVEPRECVPRADWMQELVDVTTPVAEPVSHLRLVHAYHLFGHITRERIEPELQTFDGQSWTAHHMVYKPGPVERSLPLVAPHQPRVDFRLWFYGLGFRRGQPRYVANLLDRLCHDPAAVQPLFVDPLPAAPRQARVAFWRYHFSDPDQRDNYGVYWTREALGALDPRRCDLRTRSGSIELH